MQHFDLASIRATVIPSDELLRFETPLVIEGWSEIDTSSDQALPVDAFTVECEALLDMPRRERHARFKASSKARDLSRRSARAAKRAFSYIA